MMKINPEKRYKNGIELKPILKRLPNCYGGGLTWYLVYPDGKEVNTMLSASGRDMYKRELIELQT
jgi:hypothetical protein